MIKTNLEYQITGNQVENFKKVLNEIPKPDGSSENIDPLFYQIQRDAVNAQLQDLLSDLKEYEQIRSCNPGAFPLTSLEEVPLNLIKSRIAAGYSQEEMAQFLNLDSDAYIKHENNEFIDADGNLILSIAIILNIPISEEVQALLAFTPKNEVLTQLKEAGINKDFIIKRINSRNTVERLGELSDVGFLKVIGLLRRVFGFDFEGVLGNVQLKFNFSPEAARFKLPANANENYVNLYTTYAHYIAQLALKATSNLKPKLIPNHPGKFFLAVKDYYGSVTFENVLRYAWDLGICIFPLNDPGAFHGAFWRVDGRNVIVLKQRVRYESRWLFDLLHEIWHAIQEPEKEERTLIDFEDEELYKQYTREERTAHRFAGEIILAGKAEKLAEKCMERAHFNGPALKNAVIDVAKDENIPVDGLANYLAYRLSMEDFNWWPVANNLQTKSRNPWIVCRDVFLEKAKLENLDESEQLLIFNALYDEEEEL
jgi:Zn-dependent peptidase ImmA (M78 family)/DNA-binding XRE family transcriptional regulator